MARRFEFDGECLELEPNYNAAPTQNVLTVVGSENRRGGFMRWGLIPHWAKTPSIGSRMINARAETVARKPAFRSALRRRRCLVLADGFYEWQRAGSVKKPMRIVLESGKPFAFAGLWAVWKDLDGNTVPSCTILTTEANDLLRPIHNRMPVILPREMEEFWLDRDVEDSAILENALTAYPSDCMQTFPVSKLVNSVRNNGPELLEPVGYSDTRMTQQQHQNTLAKQSRLGNQFQQT